MTYTTFAEAQAAFLVAYRAYNAAVRRRAWRHERRALFDKQLELAKIRAILAKEENHPHAAIFAHDLQGL